MKKILSLILSFLFITNLFGQKVILVHTNDTHGGIFSQEKSGFGEKPIGGSASLYSMVKQYRKKAVLEDAAFYLFSAGDAFQGTIVVNMTKGKCMSDVMNIMRYDGMTLGNHEFDYGKKPLNEFTNKINFPILCANAVYKKSNRFYKNCIPFKQYNRKGIKIAVIGVITDDMEKLAFEKNVSGIEFLNVQDTVRKYVDRIRKYNDIVVVLSHIGFKADKRLAKNVDGIDIIIGGHTNTPINEVLKVKNTIICQTSAMGLIANVLEFDYNKDTKKITAPKVISEPLFHDKFPEDQKIKTLLAKYDKIVKAQFSKVIGNNKKYLVSKKYKFPTHFTALDMHKEYQRKFKNDILSFIPKNNKEMKKPYVLNTNIGCFLTDVFKKMVKVDMAFINMGGIRNDLKKGDITLESIYNVLPFDNTLITAKLKGKYIKDIFKISHDNKKYMQFSKGLKVIYDMKHNMVNKVLFNGKELEDEKVYSIALNDFILQGGDGYVNFKHCTDIYDTGFLLRDFIVRYLKENSVIEYKMDNRTEIIE